MQVPCSVCHPHHGEPLLDSESLRPDVNRRPPPPPPLPQHRDDDERAEHRHADGHACTEEQQRFVLCHLCAEFTAHPVVRDLAGGRLEVSGGRKAAVGDDVTVKADGRFGSRVMSGRAKEAKFNVVMVLKLPDIKPF